MPFFYLQDVLRKYNFSDIIIQKTISQIPANFFTINQFSSSLTEESTQREYENILSNFEKGIIGIEIEQEGKVMYLCGYQVNVTYQMNNYAYIDNVLATFVITDYDSIQNQSNDLKANIKKQSTIWLICSCTTSAFIILLIFRNVWMTSRNIIVPITKLIEILNKLTLKHESESLFNVDDDLIDKLIQEKEQFLHTKECKHLFDAFERLLQTLKYASAYSDEENECNQLLHWNKAAQFFSRHSSHRSLGICLSNIGKIHYLQKRYLESVQAYSSSIIQADYELGVYGLIEQSQNQDILILEIKFKRTYAYSRSLQKLLKKNKENFLWVEFKRIMINLVEQVEIIGQQTYYRKLIILLNMATLLIDLNLPSKAQKYIDLAIITQKYIEIDQDILHLEEGKGTNSFLSKIQKNLDESKPDYQKYKRLTRKRSITKEANLLGKNKRTSNIISTDQFSDQQYIFRNTISISNNQIFEQQSFNNSSFRIQPKLKDSSYTQENFKSSFNNINKQTDFKLPLICKNLEQSQNGNKIIFDDLQSQYLETRDQQQKQKQVSQYELSMNSITPHKLGFCEGDLESLIQSSSIKNELISAEIINLQYVKQQSPSQYYTSSSSNELSQIYSLWLKQKVLTKLKQRNHISKIEEAHLNLLVQDDIINKEKLNEPSNSKPRKESKLNKLIETFYQKSFQQLDNLIVNESKRLTLNVKQIYKNYGTNNNTQRKTSAISSSNNLNIEFKDSSTSQQKLTDKPKFYVLKHQNVPNDILKSIISLLKAKVSFKKHNLKEAAELLTEIFEQNQVQSSQINHKVLKFLVQIFQNSKKNSDQIQQIYNSYGSFSLHITFIIDCNSLKSQFETSKIISSIVLKILFEKLDTFSIHLNDRFQTTLCTNINIQKYKHLTIDLLKNLFSLLQYHFNREQDDCTTSTQNIVYSSNSQINFYSQNNLKNQNSTQNQQISLKFILQKSLFSMFTNTFHEQKVKRQQQQQNSVKKTAKKIILIISDNMLPQLSNKDEQKLKRHISQLDIDILHYDLSNNQTITKSKGDKALIENEFFLSPTINNLKNKQIKQQLFINETLTQKKSLLFYLSNQRQKILKFIPIPETENL